MSEKNVPKGKVKTLLWRGDLRIQYICRIGWVAATVARTHGPATSIPTSHTHSTPGAEALACRLPRKGADLDDDVRCPGPSMRFARALTGVRGRIEARQWTRRILR